MKRRFYLTGLLLCIAVGAVGANAEILPYLNDSIDIEVRVEDALSRLTLEEKIAMIHAQSKFTSPGVPRLGIPDLAVNDGPQGVRNDTRSTYYPCGISLASTWNTSCLCRNWSARIRCSDFRLP